MLCSLTDINALLKSVSEVILNVHKFRTMTKDIKNVLHLDWLVSHFRRVWFRIVLVENTFTT